MVYEIVMEATQIEVRVGNSELKLGRLFVTEDGHHWRRDGRMSNGEGWYMACRFKKKREEKGHCKGNFTYFLGEK